MRKNKFYINCTLISILISFLSSGCSSEGKKGQNMAELPPLKVSTYEIKSNDIEVSLFIDPTLKSIELSNMLGASWVELHTGTYANIYAMLNTNLRFF